MTSKHGCAFQAGLTTAVNEHSGILAVYTNSFAGVNDQHDSDKLCSLFQRERATMRLPKPIIYVVETKSKFYIFYIYLLNTSRPNIKTM